MVKETVTAKAKDAVKFTKTTALDPKFQVTAASTAAGAVAGGTVGTVTGGTIGAAVGVLPALFTFGLSIPIFAVVGGGMGLAAGGSAGAVGGGAAGYYGYTYRKGLKNKATSLKTKVLDSADLVKGKVCDSASQVSKSLGFGGTGGTA